MKLGLTTYRASLPGSMRPGMLQHHLHRQRVVEVYPVGELLGPVQAGTATRLAVSRYRPILRVGRADLAIAQPVDAVRLLTR